MHQISNWLLIHPFSAAYAGAGHAFRMGCPTRCPLAFGHMVQVRIVNVNLQVNSALFTTTVWYNAHIRADTAPLYLMISHFIKPSLMNPERLKLFDLWQPAAHHFPAQNCGSGGANPHPAAPHTAENHPSAPVHAGVWRSQQKHIIHTKLLSGPCGEFLSVAVSRSIILTVNTAAD